MSSVDTLLLSVPSAPVWSNSFEHPQRMEGRGVAEQARIVLFPGIPWVHCSEVFTQNVQRCSVSVQCSHWMGVCWREGKGHLPWGCCNLSALASTSPIKSISAVAEILAFLNGSRALHTVNEREVSLLCLPFIPGLVSGGEKNRISHSGKLDLSQCLCTLLYSGAVELFGAPTEDLYHPNMYLCLKSMQDRVWTKKPTLPLSEFLLWAAEVRYLNFGTKIS